ncbi:mitochondrial translation release factor in rescue isoform X2 [Hydra vulgaris]|uniref:Mitochondrial translation release factor in rescue isoform X2 n=1 Tax=Hydra vulgaris TaxID=6087 RepID=A0ABM4CPF7_HYDVU
MAVARGVLSFHMGSSFLSRDLNLYNCWLSKKKLVSSCYDNSQTIEKKSDTVILKESDFQEKFIKGSGPGGQKINKTSNCVELKHDATGIIVKCQETRSLERNRVIARERLLEKLRFLYNPSESKQQQRLDAKQKQEKNIERKRRLREEAIKKRIEI